MAITRGVNAPIAEVGWEAELEEKSKLNEAVFLGSLSGKCDAFCVKFGASAVCKTIRKFQHAFLILLKSSLGWKSFASSK